MNIQKGFRALIMLLFCCLLAGCGPAKINVQAASNNEQRLVGTWIAENDSSTWVFNSDKTGTTTIRRINYKYGATDNKIVIFFDNNPAVADYSISSDSRTLILSGLNGFQNPLGIGTSAWLFRKSN